MTHERVLLVDDEREFTDALSRRMQARGIDVDAAGSGKEALHKVSTKSYDAIVLDLLMPEMDGLETLRRLLAQQPGLQVILLTGRATLEAGVEAIKLGALDFLEKPAEIQQLLQKIQEAKARRMLLVQKQAEERIKDILETKWW